MHRTGRRLLRLHLTQHLFSRLSSSHPALLSTVLTAPSQMPLSIESILDTKTLGASVGKAWRLEEALRWREVRGQDGEMTGLWKCRGAGVEGVIGMVFTTQVSQTLLLIRVGYVAGLALGPASHRPMQAPRLGDQILSSLSSPGSLTDILKSKCRVSTQRTEYLSSSSCRISLSRSPSSGLSLPPPPRPTLPLPHRVRHERRGMV